jgi:hypothetical protein
MEQFIILLFKLTLKCMKLKKIERRMASSGMLRHVALVRTNVLEDLSASIIRVTRIGVLGTTLAVTGYRCS